MSPPIAFTYYVTLRGQLFAVDPANLASDCGQVLLAFGDGARTEDALRQAFAGTASLAGVDADVRAQHARIAATLSGFLEGLVHRGYLLCLP